MKIAEYKQMMAYLTRPGFNGGGSVRNKTVLPKKKPEEEVKKRKIKNFEKAKPALENPKEVREMFKTGGSPDYSLRSSLKSKNPSLYNKILELAKDGDMRLSDIRRHPEVLKLNKGKPVMFETVKNSVERGLGKRTLNKIKNISEKGKFKSETRKFVEDNIDKIKKDYLKGVSTTDLSKKYLNVDKSSTTLETVLKENLTKAEKSKRPDIIGKNKFQQVKKDPKKLKAILEDIPKMANKEVQEKHKISNTTLDEIKNEYGLKFGKMLKKTKDPKVTERLQKTVDAIESIELPEGQLDGNKTVIKNLAAKLNKTIPEFLGDVSRIRTQPDRFKISKQLKKDLGRFPNPKFFREALKAKGFGKRTIDTVTAVEKAAKQAVSSGSNLEHALPQSLIKEFNLPKKYLLTAERTSGFLNQFKKQFDNQLLKAAKEYSAGNISYPDYKKEVARISKIVSDKTGGYKIGYVDFVDGKAVPVTPQESLLKGEGDLGKKTKGLKNFFKNAVYHNTLFDNFNANPNDPSFATLRDEINKRPNQFIRENDAEKTAKAINNFTRPEQFYDFYKKNPDNIFFKALTRTASLAGGKGKMLLAGGASLPFLATALAADTGTEIKEAAESFPTKTAAGAGLAAATVGTKTGRDLFSKGFKGFDRFLLRPLTAIEAPAAALPQSAFQAGKLIGDVKRRKQTDVKGMDITLPTSLSSLAASKKFGLDLFADNAGRIKKFLRAGFTQPALRTLSRGSVFATPIIETGIQGYNAYQALQDARKNASVFEPRVDTALGEAPISYYNKIMSELPEVDRSGAAGGGIMKMAGKSSGPAPESGPTPQGLDFLMKRGR